MNVNLNHRPLLYLFPSNLCDAKKVLPNRNALSSRASSFKCCLTKNGNSSEPVEVCNEVYLDFVVVELTLHSGFSILKRDMQGEIGSVWSFMGFYVFSIHVPLSFGGISAAANILHQLVLDPQTGIFLMLGIQTLELSIVLLFLKCPWKPQFDFEDCFQANKSSKQRSWLLASVVGVGFLLFVVLITSYIADRLIGPKDVNNPFLKENLTSGWSSLTASILVYCLVTPLLEEVVYRGFLLKSLSSKMKWLPAVTISSFVFSAAHFSVDNFLQLFVVGFVLGSSFCWSGNLSAPVAIHSLYNALILLLTYVS
ncbi:CAAX amino terminal protease family protein [Striga asiatica]|uniref:CAAX amino terminal protease family protein n=1 Tax=Striga asiatica TaxID=4170 RepID=A0A5A7P126_STRAF|nr:CAAX amino terminal protease family protein [Striga asiatica]